MANSSNTPVVIRNTTLTERIHILEERNRILEEQNSAYRAYIANLISSAQELAETSTSDGPSAIPAVLSSGTTPTTTSSPTSHVVSSSIDSQPHGLPSGTGAFSSASHASGVVASAVERVPQSSAPIPTPMVHASATASAAPSHSIAATPAPPRRSRRLVREGAFIGYEGLLREMRNRSSPARPRSPSEQIRASTPTTPPPPYLPSPPSSQEVPHPHPQYHQRRTYSFYGEAELLQLQNRRPQAHRLAPAAFHAAPLPTVTTHSQAGASRDTDASVPAPASDSSESDSPQLNRKRSRDSDDEVDTQETQPTAVATRSDSRLSIAHILNHGESSNPESAAISYGTRISSTLSDSDDLTAGSPSSSKRRKVSAGRAEEKGKGRTPNLRGRGTK